MKTQTLRAGTGAWDVTTFPFGGDFIRPKTDLPISNPRESAKAGWLLGETAYPPRKGVRTICFQGNVNPALAQAKLGGDGQIHGS